MILFINNNTSSLNMIDVQHKNNTTLSLLTTTLVVYNEP